MKKVQGIIVILLSIGMMTSYAIAADPKTIAKEFKDRRSKLITAWIKRKDIGNIMQNYPIKALAILREAELTGEKDQDKLDKANSLILKSLDFFNSKPDPGDGGDSALWVWHGWPTNLARIYVQYKDRSDLLYESTQDRMKGERNRAKSLRGYQNWICRKDNRKVGIKKFPEAFDDSRTEGALDKRG